MGNDCSVCSCNDQKVIDETTALHFEKKRNIRSNNINEKE